MRINYQYSKLKTLEPTTGDRISELMNIKALQHAGFAVKFGATITDRFFSQLAYVRANEPYFDKMKGIKRIWFASPYNFRCMLQADAIATFTDVWTSLLVFGREFNLNPDGKVWGNKVFTMPQTIDPVFFDAVKLTNHVFSVCITGRLVNSTYPKTLMEYWLAFRKKYDAVLFIATHNITKDLSIPKYTQILEVPHRTMPNLLGSMSLMIAGQHGEEWEYCGNMKILEAAAVGLPIIMERSAAREEDFGYDYPLFVPRGTMTNPDMKDELFKAFDIYVQDPHCADPFLRLAAKRHSIEVTSIKIRQAINKIIPPAF